MTKILGNLVALAAITFALTTQTARAERADGAPVNGAFTVTFALEPGQGICAGNFAVEAHGIGQTAQGPMFFTIKKCFFLASATYAGTFALCPSDSVCGPDSNGALSGTYAGASDPYTGDFPGLFSPFHGTLTITRDNGRNQNATGTITFTAIAAFASAPSQVPMGTAYYALRGTGPRGQD